MPHKVCYDMKETSGESAPTYATVAKWNAELKPLRVTYNDLHQHGQSCAVNKEPVENINKLVTNDQ